MIVAGWPTKRSVVADEPNHAALVTDALGEWKSPVSAGPDIANAARSARATPNPRILTSSGLFRENSNSARHQSDILDQAPEALEQANAFFGGMQCHRVHSRPSSLSAACSSTLWKEAV